MKSHLLELIKKGREGGNIGLSIGLPKIESYMDSYLPGTSYLIFARSGVGNTLPSVLAIILIITGEYR